MNGKFMVGGRALSFRSFSDNAPITQIILATDENAEDAFYAGEDGNSLTVYCPWATQQMANDLLAKAQGFQYQGFEASMADLSGAAERGDGITVGGVYGMLADRTIYFNPSMSSDIAAPYEEEVNHEFQYTSPIRNDFNRQVGQVRASLTVAADSITQQIAGVNGEISQIKVSLGEITAYVGDQINGLESEITQTASSITSYVDDQIAGVNSTITQTAGALTAQINAVDGRVTSLSANLDGIEASVSGLEGDYSNLSIQLGRVESTVSDVEGNLSSVQQTVNGLTSTVSDVEGNLSSVQQTVNGLTSTVADVEGNLSSVQQTVNGLEITTSSLDASVEGLGNGTTKISGGCIKTGSVIANVSVKSAKYYSPDMQKWMEMSADPSGDNYGAFRLMNTYYGRVPYFSIFDNETGGGIVLYAAGEAFLYVDATAQNAIAKPRGAWDFSSASVSGVYLEFS